MLKAKIFLAQCLDAFSQVFYFNMRANGALNSIADTFVPLFTSHVLRLLAFHLPQLAVLL
ncbi:MAG: hypothetical protein V1847_01355 [Candidatus Diapherotrites archaeon]